MIETYSFGTVSADAITYSDISIHAGITSTSDIDGVKIYMGVLQANVLYGETSYTTRIRLFTDPFIQDLGDILTYNLPQGTHQTSLLVDLHRFKVIPNETSRMSVAIVAAVEFYAGGKWQTARTMPLFGFGLPALRSYAVSYYPNGASAAAVTATKYYNRAMTLGTGFSRPGYRFTGWNTAADGTGTAYAGGATYTGNAALTLYAQWKALPTVASLELRRTDASGEPDDMGPVIEARAECTKDAALSIASLAFSCGSVTATGSPGEWVALDVSARADTAYTVTATVQDSAGYTASRSAASSTAYEKPSITSARAYRVDPNGNLDDEGTCMAVDVEWRVAAVGSQQGPSSLTIACGGLMASAPAFEPAVSGVSATGSSLIAMGLVPVEPAEGDSPVVAGWWVKVGTGTEADPYRYERATDAAPAEGTQYYEGAYSTEESYAITVTLADSINSVAVGDTLTTAFYTMDVLGDSFADQRPGHGIAFGKPCNREGFDVAMDQYSYGEREYPTFIRATKPAEADLPTLPCMVYVTAGKSLWLFMGGGVAVQLNERYRIGDIHWSLDPTPPDQLYGGTWLQLSGYMLRPASSGVDMDAAADGGSDTVTLGVANLPVHGHSMGHTHTMAHYHGTGDSGHTVWPTMLSGKIGRGSIPTGTASGKYAWMSTTAGGQDALSSRTATGGSSAASTGGSSAANTGNTGSGQAYSNLPAYKNVYAWVRVA